jgi:hypothetical protein
MESTKLSARVVGYVDAIGRAREAGMTWKQLAELFHADTKYFAAACRAARKSKYQPAEQKPLPEIEEHPPTNRQERTVSPVQQKREIPRVERNGQPKNDGMTDAQRIIARIPKIGE